jgi:hypothetical protein
MLVESGLVCIDGFWQEVLGKDRVWKEFLGPVKVCCGKGVDGGRVGGEACAKGDWW